jgi:predicted ATPase
MSDRSRIVLTGGPGGGKSALIDDLRADPAWAKHILA